MDLFIIRHAQSSNNALADVAGRHYDPGLTELGVRQAEILAEHLATGAPRLSARTRERIGFPDQGYGFTHLYCSAMHRALLTTRVVGAALGLQPEIWVDLHERGGLWQDHGEAGIRGYPGMTRSQIGAEFPDCLVPDPITEDGWWCEGYEPLPAAIERAQRVAAQLCARAATDHRIAMITHCDFAHNLIKALLDLPQNEANYLHHENTGITYLSFGPDQSPTVRYVNRIDHLPPELVS